MLLVLHILCTLHGRGEGLKWMLKLVSEGSVRQTQANGM